MLVAGGRGLAAGSGGPGTDGGHGGTTPVVQLLREKEEILFVWCFCQKK